MEYVLLLGFILFVIIAIEIKWMPRIDITEDRDVLLWYNGKGSNAIFNVRKYIQLL